jgi:hypothetical protein
VPVRCSALFTAMLPTLVSGRSIRRACFPPLWQPFGENPDALPIIFLLFAVFYGHGCGYKRLAKNGGAGSATIRELRRESEEHLALGGTLLASRCSSVLNS